MNKKTTKSDFKRFDNNLAVVILSCDKFSDLWENNKVLFEKFWKNHPKLYLVSNDKNPLGFKLFNENFYFFSDNFSFRLLNILKNVKEEYVLLTLDDYLICDYVNDNELCFLFNFMIENNLDYLRLFKRTITNGWISKKDHIHRLPLTKKCYEVNLYPSIWKKNSLTSLIKYDEDPWKFEVRMTRRAKEKELKCGWIDKKYVYPFVDTVRKGKYLRSAYRFLKREKLFISDRKVRTVFETISLNIRTFVSRYFSFLVLLLKKISKKKYFSDYWESDD